MIVLGLNPGFGGFNFHDPAAVLLVDGRVVAAQEEERTCRIKGAPGRFPADSISACLRLASISPEQVDVVAVSYCPKKARLREQLEASMAIERSGLTDPASTRTGVGDKRVARLIAELARLSVRSEGWTTELATARLRTMLGTTGRTIDFVPHHEAHVASAQLSSGRDDCCGLVVDGVGEISSTSGWQISNGHRRLSFELPVTASLGYIYAAFTAWLGFTPWQHEGKVMALAPYGGADDRVAARLNSIVDERSDGTDFAAFVLGSLGDGLALDHRKASQQIASLLGEPPRTPGAALTDLHRSVAWWVQSLLERELARLSIRLKRENPSQSRLVMSGGVAMNCKAVRVVREERVFDDVIVQPVAGDAGSALGAAVVACQARNVQVENPMSLLLGDVPASQAELAASCAVYGLDARDYDQEWTVHFLLKGGVLMWMTGRAEFGARALGARSILADPRHTRMREVVNSVVKRREGWRPFGAAILAEQCGEILEDCPSRRLHMIDAFRVRESWRPRLEAVVHPVDFTTRPNSVHHDTQPKLHQLMQRFAAKTGVPALLNTSLNGRDEPLAHSTDDAIARFYTSGAGALLLGEYILRKPGVDLDDLV